MKISVRHALSFDLGTPTRAVHHLLLTALATPQQKVERWSIEMPGFADAAVFRDGYGNRAHLVTQLKPEGPIDVVVSGMVETFDMAGVLGKLDYDPMPAMFRRPTPETKADPKLIEGLKDGPDRIALFHELMGRIHAALGGSTQMQAEGTQSQSQGSGAKPQDYALAFIGAARALNIPARYVTGYLLDEGVSSFHAWAEGWDEGLGWIGFDPAMNVCPAEDHVRLASGLDMTSTMPIRSVPVWAEMPAETVELTSQDPST